MSTHYLKALSNVCMNKKRENILLLLRLQIKTTNDNIYPEPVTASQHVPNLMKKRLYRDSNEENLVAVIVCCR